MASKLSALIASTDEKTTPVDADKFPLLDSAATNYFKWIGWGSLKTALASIFPLLAGKSGGQTLIGGTGVTDKLVLQGTSGNGTGTATAIEVKVGNNGALTPFSLLNNGRIVAGMPPVFNYPENSSGVVNIYTGQDFINVDSHAPGEWGLVFRGQGPSSIFKITGNGGNGQVIVGAVNINYFLSLFSGNQERARVLKTGETGFGTQSPSAFFHIVKTTEQLRLGYDASNYASFTVASDGTLTLTTNNNKIALGASRTPASASATGAAGEICWDASFIYVCTAANTWKRAAIATW